MSRGICRGVRARRLRQLQRYAVGSGFSLPPDHGRPGRSGCGSRSGRGAGFRSVVGWGGAAGAGWAAGVVTTGFLAVPCTPCPPAASPVLGRGGGSIALRCRTAPAEARSLGLGPGRGGRSAEGVPGCASCSLAYACLRQVRPGVL